VNLDPEAKLRQLRDDCAAAFGQTPRAFTGKRLQGQLAIAIDSFIALKYGRRRGSFSSRSTALAIRLTWGCGVARLVAGPFASGRAHVF